MGFSTGTDARSCTSETIEWLGLNVAHAMGAESMGLRLLTNPEPNNDNVVVLNKIHTPRAWSNYSSVAASSCLLDSICFAQHNFYTKLY